jgi:hypothetical protein
MPTTSQRAGWDWQRNRTATSDFRFREAIAEVAAKERKERKDLENKVFLCDLCDLLRQFLGFAISPRVSDFRLRPPVNVCMFCYAAFLIWLRSDAWRTEANPEDETRFSEWNG